MLSPSSDEPLGFRVGKQENNSQNFKKVVQIVFQVSIFKMSLLEKFFYLTDLISVLEITSSSNIVSW